MKIDGPLRPGFTMWTGADAPKDSLGREGDRFTLLAGKDEEDVYEKTADGWVLRERAVK